MNYKKILSPFVLISMLLCSCTNELMQEINQDGEQSNEIISGHSKKVINTPNDSNQKEILIKVKENNVELSTKLKQLTLLDGVDSVEPVFSFKTEPTELDKKHNLDKWFVVKFKENQNLTKIASELATYSFIQAVEFSKIYEVASDCKVVPLSEELLPMGSRANSDDMFNDPNLYKQWHYNNVGDKSVWKTAVAGADINVKDAWGLTTGDPSIIVAVIDEGVKYDHPDLAQNMWVNTKEIPGNGIDDDDNGYVDDVHGYNFNSNCPIKYLTGSHGTHVAGTVAAVNNNNLGICGVAGGNGTKDSGVRIMSCQIFDDKDLSAVASIRAFKYAADNGASIAQCSWGIPSDKHPYYGDDEYLDDYNGTAEKDAINYFMDIRESRLDNPLGGGGIVIFAAGNESTDRAGYPGAYRDFISVSSFTAAFLPAYYTNYDKGVNIAAPGGEQFSDFEKSAILSTIANGAEIRNNKGEVVDHYEGDYGYMQGTSMACPHVSGVAALGLSYAKKLGKKYTVDEFNSMILSSTKAIDKYLVGETADGPNMKDLNNYRGKMGTGGIDAWKLLMSIEGIPCLVAPIGKSNFFHLDSYFGGDAKNLKYLSVEISEAGMNSLGLKSAPEIKFGKLKLMATKLGSAKCTIRAIAGGKVLGSGDVTGGKEITRVVSIISRPVDQNKPGWL